MAIQPLWSSLFLWSTGSCAVWLGDECGRNTPVAPYRPRHWSTRLTFGWWASRIWPGRIAPTSLRCRRRSCDASWWTRPDREFPLEEAARRLALTWTRTWTHPRDALGS